MPMPYVDLDEENEVQECTPEKQNSEIEQLAFAIQRLADTNVDRTLFGNFWLNELKSLDDTIRLITNINILLIAGYSTIVATNFTIISDNLTQSTISNGVNFILISIPIVFWICSIVIAGENHNLPPQNAEPLLDNKRASDYLKNIYYWRKDIEDTALTLLFLGPLYLILVFNFVAMIKVVSEETSVVPEQSSFLLFILATIMFFFNVVKFLNFFDRTKKHRIRFFKV